MAAPPAKTQNSPDAPTTSVLGRLLHDYVQGHWSTLAVAMLLMAFTAGTSTALAWLLDPIVKTLFIQKDPNHAAPHSGRGVRHPAACVPQACTASRP